jgi:tripartite-type tricarboxylate transporter receptor subunit TctC
VPDILFVREDSSYKSLQDLVAFGKANPNKIKVANSGSLGADFMTTLLIEKVTGAKFTQIPFNGGSKALQGTLAGTADAMVASNIYAFSQKGQLRPLAIATKERDRQLPDVPTFTELGFPVVAERFRALAGPPDMPKEVVNYWADVCQKVVANPAFQEESSKIGAPAEYRGPAEAKASFDALANDIREIVESNKLAE